MICMLNMLGENAREKFVSSPTGTHFVDRDQSVQHLVEGWVAQSRIT